jgi:hypothetical protein
MVIIHSYVARGYIYIYLDACWSVVIIKKENAGQLYDDPVSVRNFLYSFDGIAASSPLRVFIRHDPNH